MTRVIQHLWFEKDMEGALTFYVSLIPGSAIDWISPLPADTPSGPAGTVRTAGFTLGDQRYRALEAQPAEPFRHSFSIIVECGSQAEIDHLWDALSNGGSPGQCGWLKDRWGLSWQIVPERLGRLMAGGSGKRVVAAMLKMTKIDIAALEEAAV
jgi:predicted 3-demethylubiquinone-9 3-methyltransferase (glyoxalase superfamily)